MNPLKTFGVIGGAIRASTTAHPASHPSASETSPPPVITISRQAGIDTGALTERTADLLNNRSKGGGLWKIYDQQLIDHVAREHHLSTELVASHDEHDESVLELAMHGLSSAEQPEAVALKIGAAIRHFAQQGHAIIVGRGGQSILAKCESAVHVRLIAPESWRVNMLATTTGADRREAMKTLRRIDTDRTRYMKAHFNHDSKDPLLYGIILNMSQIDVAEAASAIASLIPLVAMDSHRQE